MAAWMALLALAADAAAVLGGFMLAVWIRFDSGWLAVPLGRPDLGMYRYGAGVAALLAVLVFQAVGLYRRPQQGRFTDHIPRLARALGWSFLLSMVLAFALRTDPPFSRLVVLLAFVVVSVLVLVERALLFRFEYLHARRHGASHAILIIGTGPIASRLRRALERDPRLRCRVLGFLGRPQDLRDPAVSPEAMLGTPGDLARLAETRAIDRVIVADSPLAHDELLQLILICEQRMIDFALVPDYFQVLTHGVTLSTIEGIPLLHPGHWPLDYVHNRFLKRCEDLAGAVCGLLLSAPVIAVAALWIRRESPGPVFYRQERCGEDGRRFTLYKLRTMVANAESDTGPVWASPDDPRRTRGGAFLRRYNLDELPQFWNVLKGDMSLVGPRPERPHFVEQFREDLCRYMWRHASKPGMTGWAQINGLRGQTSIEERIRFDLYYLENWSLALDFKILARTFFARQNAY